MNCLWPNCVCDDEKCYYKQEMKMGTKLQPGKYDCYKNALPDEPMFTLLGRDPQAPAVIRQWVYQRRTLITMGDKPPSDNEMLDEAMSCAADMERWRHENNGKWRNDPDVDLRLNIQRAIEAVNKLPPEEQKKMWEDQRQSWTRQDRD